MAEPTASTNTVWHAFYEVLRSYGINTIFGNPGSTEQPMLKNFPADFRYVFALQEASAVAMADGYAQAMKTPAIVSLHTAAGTGNGMGTLMTAFLNKTPLVVIAGQQTRHMLIGDPFLANREAITMPRPWVKWSYEPVKATDVPQAIVRALATAMIAPAGPVYLSIPLDDWDAAFDVRSIPKPRIVSTRVGPDPSKLAWFADRIRASKKVGLVLGAEVDRSSAWPAAVKLAEGLQLPVFQAPLADRAVFPETHELFKGGLPSARGPLSDLLARYGFDLILVVGAEIWRYYPWVPGPVTNGAEVLQITSDPHDAASALVGDSLISDVGLALEALCQVLVKVDGTAGEHNDLDRHRSQMHAVPIARDSNEQRSTATLMTATQAFSALGAVRPQNSILVHESPSNTGDLLEAWRITQPESCFTFASGGLGWGGPASVGIAFAQKANRSQRPVVLVIGDGSLHYSVQFIYSAVRENLRLVILVPVNEEYAILKEFAELEKTPNVPALDLPGLNPKASAEAYGCPSFRADDSKHLQTLFGEALQRDGPTLIEFLIDPSLQPLIKT